MENLDPNTTPGEPGSEGQPVESTEPPTPEVDPTEERLVALEQQNKDLQHKLTQQGRERKMQETQTPPAEPAKEDFDWNDPGASIKGSVRQEFAEFEARQDRRRQADEMIQHTADHHGIPVPELQKYYRRLEEASQDPVQLMETVARMYLADNAEEAVSQARNAAQESVERNARGVTSKGAATQPTPEEKPYDEMSDEEKDDFVMRKYGKADWQG